MKSHLFNTMALKSIALALSVSGFAGCSTTSPFVANPRGTAALPLDPYAVQGRDLDKGAATAGPVSSLDPTGNAADWSVYDARQAAR